MIYLIIAVVGLSLGSFVNALVWRIHKQAQLKTKKATKSHHAELERLSITKGRSMCMKCGHELTAKDLVPVVSWLWLRGKCRYCKKKIDDTPLAELLVPLILLISYVWWPHASGSWSGLEFATFGIWALIVTCFVALIIYDAKWYLLPDRIVVPLTLLAVGFALLVAIDEGGLRQFLLATTAGLLISGLFYSLLYVSKGQWIGGGDVKLGLSLGLIVGNPLYGVLVVFIASVIGTVISLPAMLVGSRHMTSKLPFGPYLIIGTVITLLLGAEIVAAYQGLILQ